MVKSECQREPARTQEKITKGKVSDRDIKWKHDTDHQRNFVDCVKSRECRTRPQKPGILVQRFITWRILQLVNEQFIDNDEANMMLWADMRSPWEMDELRHPELTTS